MRAKRLIASVLSFALCAGAMPVVTASAEESVPAAVTMGVNSSFTADAANNVGAAAVTTTTAAAASPKVTTTTTAGNESVVTIRLGDLNNDGNIDAIDASAILASYAASATSGGVSTLSAMQTIAADVNKDGNADAVDASNVLAYYAYSATNGTLSIEDYLNSLKKQSPATTTTTAKPVTTTTTTATAKTTAKPVSSTTTSSAAVSSTSTTSAPVSTTSSVQPVSSTTTTAPVTTTTSQPSVTSTTTTSVTTTTTTTITLTTTTTGDPYKVASIKLSKTEIELNVGTGGISYVTMLPATADKREIWSCSDESVAVVDNEGWIVGKSEGVCVVTVTSFNNPAVKADIKVTVKDPNKVNAIRLTKTDIRIPIGGGDISYVTMLPANATNKAEIWTSSDSTIASVNSEGWITGLKEGTCVITVASKANPSVKAEIKVTVTDPTKVSEIKLSKYEMDLIIGTSDISYVTMLPKTATNVDEVWTSSNPAIASVDNWGNVYGLAEGSCVVSVISKANPSVKADIKVTVRKKPLPTTTTTSATTTTTTSTTTTTVTTTHLIQNINGATYVDGILIVNKTYGLSKDYSTSALNGNALEIGRASCRERV